MTNFVGHLQQICGSPVFSTKKTEILQSSKLDFRIYWPENFKIRIFI